MVSWPSLLSAGLITYRLLVDDRVFTVDAGQHYQYRTTGSTICTRKPFLSFNIQQYYTPTVDLLQYSSTAYVTVGGSSTGLRYRHDI